MRHTILLDKKISEREYKKWVKDDTAFWEEHLGITPTYELRLVDYSNYPTFVDADGDIRPTNAYLQSLVDPVVKSVGEFGTDFIMVMVYEDNWRSDTDTTKGIWGTNYSYVFGKQCLDYCRWDKENPVNTFGTAYHERHHSFDAIIKQETGVDVQPLLGVKRYDAEITHGGTKPWKYIRNKENTESLKVMRPHLHKAFLKRKTEHEKILGLIGKVIDLAAQVIYLLKMKQNKKEGISKV